MSRLTAILERLNLAPRRRPCAGALCWRRGRDGVEILLVTTRRTGRWTPPKGRLEPDLPPHLVAAAEALEEAGAEGRIAATPLGEYRGAGSPRKREPNAYVVTLFALEVTGLRSRYKEGEQRQRRWFSQEQAAAAVTERSLRRLIRDFSP